MSKLIYGDYLKPYARKLRSNLTDAERLLWQRIRRKQILETQFFRQRAIKNFIVDFYAPKARLVVELDGGQHFEDENLKKDKVRDAYLRKMGLLILRFDNNQVMTELECVLEEIYRVIRARKIPPNPPFIKGGMQPPHTIEG
jgi:very-short-patch-repair endonuclease